MNTNDIRELSFDETDRVSGGNPIVIGAVLGFLGGKVLEKAFGDMSLADFVEKKAGEKKGKEKQ